MKRPIFILTLILLITILIGAFYIATTNKNGPISLKDKIALISPDSEEIDPGISSPQPKPEYWPKNYDVVKKQAFREQLIPYEIHDAKLEYNPKADHFTATISNTSNRQEYLDKKKGLENALKSEGIDICALFIYWTGDPQVMNQLAPAETLTSGCF